MKYNLAKNSELKYLTTSGTVSRIFFWEELEKLTDGSNSSVPISSTEVVILESIFQERIKIDTIEFHLGSATPSGIILSNVDFYYKDFLEDDYILADKTMVGEDIYGATLPYPSAPVSVLATLSGVDCDLQEFFISNADHIITFGEDGMLDDARVEHAPIGSLGDIQTLNIKNSDPDLSNNPVKAYIAIDPDPKNKEANWLLKLAAHEQDTFVGLEDGIVLSNNDQSAKYTWDMGEYIDTFIDIDDLKLDPAGISLTSDLGEIPFTQAGHTRWGFGVGYHAWTYDRDRRCIYCLVNDTWLKLYKFDYSNMEWDTSWTFLSKIDPEETLSAWDTYANCHYLGDDYVYVQKTNQGDFGRYNLNGAENNWEELTSMGLTPGAQDMTYTCNDSTEYIYAIMHDYAADTGKYFARYSTVSGTTAGWEQLDTGYVSTYTTHVYYYTYSKVSMCHDPDRNCLYLLMGTFTTDTGYVQRYDIATNTWDTTWFKYTDYDASDTNHTIEYKDDWLYICAANGATEEVYRWHIPSFTWESFVVPGLTVSYSYPIYMIAVDPLLNSAVDSVTLFFSGVGSNKKNIYTHNGYAYRGQYITPIFKVDEAYDSSFFVIESTTVSGETNISHDQTQSNGTIKVVSSDTAPITRNELFIPFKYSGAAEWLYLQSFDVYSEEEDLNWGTSNMQISTGYNTANIIKVNNRNGDIYMQIGPYSTYTTEYVQILDKNGNRKVMVSDDSGTYRFSKMVITYNDSLWGYNLQDELFVYLTSDLVEVRRFDPLSLPNGPNIMEDFCVPDYGSGTYIVFGGGGTLLMTNPSATLSVAIEIFTSVTLLEGCTNGFWCVDLLQYLKKYNLATSQVEFTITLPADAVKMSSDNEGGLWVLTLDSTLLHYTSSGWLTTEVTVDSTTDIYGGHDGCVLWSNISNQVQYIDKNSETVQFQFDIRFDYPCCPALLSHTYDDSVEYKSEILPSSYDTFWTSDTADWKEIPKDGSFLSKLRYHRVNLQLLATTNEYSPVVHSVVMAPTIQLPDVYPGEVRDFYIRTDIPAMTTVPTYYRSRLRAWWDQDYSF